MSIVAKLLNALFQPCQFSIFAGRTKTYPFRLIHLTRLFRHLLPYAIRVPKGPHSQLVQHSDLGEDVEVAEAFGLLLVAVGVEMWCFGEVLPTSVFIPDIIATLESVR